MLGLPGNSAVVTDRKSDGVEDGVKVKGLQYRTSDVLAVARIRWWESGDRK
jgi:hypothetical protein